MICIVRFWLILCLFQTAGLSSIQADEDKYGDDNCSNLDANGERLPPISKQEYFLRDVPYADEKSHEKMLDEVEQYLKKHAEYESCVEEEDIESIVKQHCLTEEQLKEVFIAAAVALSISLVLSVIGIALAADARQKFQKLDREGKRIGDSSTSNSYPQVSEDGMSNPTFNAEQ